MSDNKESIQQLTNRDAAWRAELRKAIATPHRTAIPRARMTELDPAYRITNSEASEAKRSSHPIAMGSFFILW